MFNLSLLCRANFVNLEQYTVESNNISFTNGNIQLEKIGTGYLICEGINIGSFTALYPSWNCMTYGGSLEILLSYQDDTGNFSPWFSCGVWSSEAGESKSVFYSTDLAYISESELHLNEGSCSIGPIRIKVVITYGVQSPVLYQFALTIEGKSPKEINHEFPDEIEINVPLRCQLDVPNIGREICSPTSVSMVLEYWGLNLPTEVVAAGCNDNGARIYGNWIFNVAFAGEQGFFSYFELFDLPHLKQVLALGIPVISSIKTKEIEQLDGAIRTYPVGHLVVISGYKKIQNIDYFIVNDPFWSSGKKAFYRIDQFINVWRNGASYVIIPQSEYVK